MINKVLLAHNFYRYEGGEDSVYRNEKTLLTANGIDVIPYEKHNNDIPDKKFINLISHFFSMTWNKAVYKELSDTIKNTRPDIAHFHNTFQLISPSAYAACHDNNVPVVQTLHNFRLICPGGLLQRNGSPCEKCIGKTPISAIVHGCYRESRVSSAAVTMMLTSNRINNTYNKYVDKYIALTQFSEKKFIKGGLPKEKMCVKPNFMPNAPNLGKGKGNGNGNGNYVVYVGRLSDEKGINVLLKAWEKLSTIPLIIIGDGPLAPLVKKASGNNNNSIEWLGFQDKETVIKYVSDASFLVLPSICYEGFPLTILEAYACGTPVLVSKLGNMNEVVIEGETGFKFIAGNSDDLAKTVSNLWLKRPELLNLRNSIRNHYNTLYSADKNFSQLIEIYDSAIDNFHKNKTH